jgi:hypothetical protein
MMTSDRPPNSCPKASIIRILWQQPATNSSLFPANAMRGQVNFETSLQATRPGRKLQTDNAAK